MDTNRPGWYRRIDRERLDMASWCDCIGGQEEGTYDDFVDVMGLEQGSDHGFTVNKQDTREMHPHKAFRQLKEMWVEGIELRLLRDELEAAQKIGVSSEAEEELVGAVQ